MKAGRPVAPDLLVQVKAEEPERAQERVGLTHECAHEVVGQRFLSLEEVREIVADETLVQRPDPAEATDGKGQADSDESYLSTARVFDGLRRSPLPSANQDREDKDHRRREHDVNSRPGCARSGAEDREDHQAQHDAYKDRVPMDSLPADQISHHTFIRL